MATDKPDAQPPRAIAALCDHAGEVWSFFAQVLGQRPLVRDERARHELQAKLRMLLRGSYSWRSETALEFCTRSAVKASEAFEQAGAPFDAADFATALWNEFQEEREAILERVESLYAPAVHQCHVHGDLTLTAHDAVRHLVDLLRGLWVVAEWDDWSERSSVVSNAINEARVWAVPPPRAGDANCAALAVPVEERGTPPTACDEAVQAPGQLGFLGGEKLFDALDVHPSRRDAFNKQLERARRSLMIDGDCREVREPPPNTPKYLYRVSAVAEIAKRYRTPNPA